jgi:hypothetical protein
MKYTIFIIITLFLVFTSCKKEKIQTTSENPIPIEDSQKDSILYKEFQNGFEYYTVDTFNYQDHSICSTYIPIPSDSSTSFEIDMNSDNKMDFKFNVQHVKNTTTYCGHCDTYTYSVTVYTNNQEDSIAVSDQKLIANLLKESDTINNDLKWSHLAQLTVQPACFGPFVTDFKEGYLAVKVGSSFGYVYVQKIENKNGIRILKAGFNLTPNKVIICGQKN